MAWNNGFPATYQQMYPQYQQQPQMPVYAPQMPQAAYQQQNMPQVGTQMSTANQPQPAQMLTPPTIRAEIIQIEDEAAVDKFPLGAGASQMFITRAEDKIIIKTMGANGPMPLDVYEKRPPAPPAPTFDPKEYMRRDEFDERVSAIVAAQMAQMAQQPQTAAQRRTAKKEADE